MITAAAAAMDQSGGSVPCRGSVVGRFTVLTGLHPMGLASPSQLLHTYVPAQVGHLTRCDGERCAPTRNMVYCPMCSGSAKRVARHGWKDFFLHLMGYYPFRCTLCHHRFRLRRRT